MCGRAQQAFVHGSALTYGLPWVAGHQQARVQLATKGTARSRRVLAGQVGPAKEGWRSSQRDTQVPGAKSYCKSP